MSRDTLTLAFGHDAPAARSLAKRTAKHLAAGLTALLLIGLAAQARAHFGMVIPDQNVVSQNSPKTVKLDLRFWHPMENQGMDLEKPKVEIVAAGKKTDISASLTPREVDGKKTWAAAVPVKSPGALIAAMTPPPYYEKSEDKFIIHYTKTVIGALGSNEGYDKPAGLKVEIMPLTRPFGLYAGNSFTGRVMLRGKPLAGKSVEVEFFNQDGKLAAPADAYVAQVTTTGADGSFTWTAPWAGWWGFSALTEDDAKIKKDGKDKPVEIGAVIWIYFHPPLK